MMTSRPMDQLPARDRIVLYGQVSRAIRAAARPGDLAGHDGGGSFRLLLPNVGTTEALEISSKIKAAMRQEALRGRGGVELQISLESGFDEGVRCPPV